MRTAKLILDYSKLSEAKLDQRAKTIEFLLTGNEYFPTTTPTLAEFTTIRTDYSDKLNAAANGDRTAIALKNQSKSALLAAMRQLGTSIELQANGDRAKLVSSGFELSSSGESVPPITAPTEFTILDGPNPGEVMFSIKRVPQAVSYIHEYTEELVTPDSKWVSKPTTSRKFVFTGLRSGIRIYGRVAVIGSKGQEVYSQTLSRVVQ